jgi:hypothetical protein
MRPTEILIAVAKNHPSREKIKMLDWNILPQGKRSLRVANEVQAPRYPGGSRHSLDPCLLSAADRLLIEDHE